MTAQTWIPLTDYSTKYKVSISTLRRRIKVGEVQFVNKEGRYLVRDLPLDEHRLETNHPVASSAPQVQPPPPQIRTVAPAKKAEKKAQLPKTKSAAVSNDSAVLATANKLLDELKKAYSLILQEKEEQILQLKEEVADLQTLVRVLEGENLRLKTTDGESNSVDLWLEQL